MQLLQHAFKQASTQATASIPAVWSHLDSVCKDQHAWWVALPLSCCLDGCKVLQQLGGLLVLSTHLNHLHSYTKDSLKEKPSQPAGP